MTNWRSPGLLMMLGSLELLFLVHLAEILYPGYNVSQNYISDLGVGPDPSRTIFTVAIIAFGILITTSVYLRGGPAWEVPILVGLSGAGTIGVGVFDEHWGVVHLVFAGLAFGVGSMAALVSSRTVKGPLSIVFATLGLTGLIALCLQGTKIYLGLGPGGMERMIYYPAIFWVLIYGVYLISIERCKK
ncbi:MAG TPA: DUF998 domain-containing protein [Methanomassiliicoccales archaeon]